MTRDIMLTLAITAGAMALFVWNRLRVDVVGLMVMCSLILLGLVTPSEGISGFANEAMITVAAMFVLSAGLTRTGAIDILGKWIARVSGSSELRLMVVTSLLALLASAFVNNTPVVVVLVPVVLGIARRINVSPSRLFMPISFCSQMGGTLTLIGTSTNLLVAGLIVELGLDHLHLFEITPAAAILAAVGVLYVFTIGRWLTPSRDANTDLIASYELRDYISALVVESDSPLVGHSLGESRFGEKFGLSVVGIDRGDARIISPSAATVLEREDVLLVRGAAAEIARIQTEVHLRIGTMSRPLETQPVGPRPRRMAEMIVTPRSPVVGRSLREVNFRSTYSVPVLGIQRHGAPLHERLGDIALEPGDVLLVEGEESSLLSLHQDGRLALLGAVNLPATRRRKLPVALAIMLGVVFLSAFDILPILVAALLGGTGMFLTGCLKPEEAYEEIDWMVLVLLGSLIPLGLAMRQSGAADLIANAVLQVTAPWGPYGVLAAFFFVTSALTQAMSNNAAAVVVTPIAIASAASLGISPMPLVVAVMIAASNSFMTPIGYQTNTFIYGPGGYRFSDFVRVGGPLNLIMLIAGTLVIPLFFPF